jgi:hypothetical protein
MKKHQIETLRFVAGPNVPAITEGTLMEVQRLCEGSYLVWFKGPEATEWTPGTGILSLEEAADAACWFDIVGRKPVGPAHSIPVLF